jgi:osmoprotectant transport system permease protein
VSDGFLAQHWREMSSLTTEHFLLVFVATALATLVGIPLGVLLTRRGYLRGPVLGLANIFQTIPSLALFGFLIPLLGHYGIGRIPAIIALFIYSLLPIIRNTFVGISGISPSIREAGIAMGMTDWQLLTQVELPLALSSICAGVRLATVISIGTATIAAAIGAGGLGVYIFRGLRMNDNKLILAGAIPAALMALFADYLLSSIEKALRPEADSSKRKWVVGLSLLILLLVPFSLRALTRSDSEQSHAIVVGSKDFTEQVILGEIVSQLIESQGFPVKRVFELGGDLCHRTMIAGDMDVYVEYTGTAYTAILKHSPITDAGEVLRQVKQEYASKFGIEWLGELGFNNTFAILVRGDEARNNKLRTISDAVPFARKWRVGFGQDFMSRADGYPGFIKAYGLSFAEQPHEMDLSLSYRALAAARVDLIAGNSTDGLITSLDLYQLEDDRKYFPPYDAVPIVRREILEQHPQLEDAFKRIKGSISEAQMRKLNYSVDGEHRDVKQVAKEFLEGIGVKQQ